MEAHATAKYIRISPRKMRQVVDLIRQKDVNEALAILKYTPKRAAIPVAKVVKSAVANAEHNYDLDKDKLYVASAFVNQGPTFKRFQARAMGRANIIYKRTSHITVLVKEKNK
ncbi:50S ribosomal protein L22 [Peptococcaceae bacterium SCADC1_2_3]|jgi:large subunit ribosomal protein L22|nr:50S ribosomal protein L22 [Peptococcaceae bacterium SCADC1_2_3]KFI35024.1 50S ribosomal protein L22 [Peptococcaceae bacterium SCADC1_2_3]HBQ27988.1 50S ribosomal protein L22 [Desulfotomaculum sp.]HCJ79596.1 50S ribosomal protein L22 [Desulfotomaculum sp.]